MFAFFFLFALLNWVDCESESETYYVNNLYVIVLYLKSVWFFMPLFLFLLSLSPYNDIGRGSFLSCRVCVQLIRLFRFFHGILLKPWSLSCCWCFSLYLNLIPCNGCTLKAQSWDKVCGMKAALTSQVSLIQWEFFLLCYYSYNVVAVVVVVVDVVLVVRFC